MAHTNKMVGLHLGINNLAVTSDGQKFKNPKHLEKSLAKIARLQRELYENQVVVKTLKKHALSLLVNMNILLVKRTTQFIN